MAPSIVVNDTRVRKFRETGVMEANGDAVRIAVTAVVPSSGHELGEFLQLSHAVGRVLEVLHDGTVTLDRKDR